MISILTISIANEIKIDYTNTDKASLLLGYIVALFYENIIREYGKKQKAMSIDMAFVFIHMLLIGLFS
ncbi:hypothetical protein D0T53_01450 [Dysgonomonas sp. 216]|nr:hypothetical protein [Dysgonomonas sp. 216]